MEFKVSFKGFDAFEEFLEFFGTIHKSPRRIGKFFAKLHKIFIKSALKRTLTICKEFVALEFVALLNSVTEGQGTISNHFIASLYSAFFFPSRRCPQDCKLPKLQYSIVGKWETHLDFIQKSFLPKASYYFILQYTWHNRNTQFERYETTGIYKYNFCFRFGIFRVIVNAFLDRKYVFRIQKIFGKGKTIRIKWKQDKVKIYKIDITPNGGAYCKKGNYTPNRNQNKIYMKWNYCMWKRKFMCHSSFVPFLLLFFPK